jgi:acyl-coenzyme A thioesterase PaaI-like protein
MRRTEGDDLSPLTQPRSLPMTTTQSTAPDEVPLVLESSPELIFRVARPVAEGEAVSSSMPVGPWLNGPTGRPLAGALGVLVDNVLGYAIMLHRPRPIPAGTTVRFEGRILHRGRAFAVTQVTALNESGKPCVIATVTTGAVA